MGRKQEKKTKKRVTISLAEFNENAGLGGAHPEASALPSAPKAPEQWDAVGGRPEYNSRGYKERSTGPRDRRVRTDGDDEDWSRRGPLDDDLSFGGVSSDRDWAATRREQPASEDAPERDWNDIRRGPVEAAHPTSSFDRDWSSSRSGPIEPDARSSPVEADWGSVRRGGAGPVEAEFTQSRDFSQRKPVDAHGKTPLPADTDWTNRKGPIEAEFSAPSNDRDWSARRGPVEANITDAPNDWADIRRKASLDEQPAPQKDVDWSELRHAPVEAAVPNPPAEPRPDVDWSARRSPVKSRAEIAAARSKDTKERHLDFEAARASKFRDSDEPNSSSDRGSWRRDNSASNFHPKGRGSYSDYRTRPPSTSSDGATQERDWGAARRSLPEALAPTRALNNLHENQNDQDQSRDIGHTHPLGETDVVTSLNADAETEVTGEVGELPDSTAGVDKLDDDEWTTVRANPKKAAQQARRQASGSRNSWRGRGGRDSGGRGGFRSNDRGRPVRPVRPGFGIEEGTHVSPFTAIPSATTEP